MSDRKARRASTESFQLRRPELVRAPGTAGGLEARASTRPPGMIPVIGQAKVIRVTRGRILDVAVDLRKGSPTLSQHVKVELSPDSWNQILPSGSPILLGGG